MPTLTWIGKDKVVNHHQEVPYRVLEHKYGFRAENESDKTPTDSGNKIYMATIWRHLNRCYLNTREESSASISIRRTTRAMKSGSTTTM